MHSPFLVRLIRPAYFYSAILTFSIVLDNFQHYRSLPAAQAGWFIVSNGETAPRPPRLFMCGNAGLALVDQVGQKPLDAVNSHVYGMFHRMEPDIPLDPVDIGLLGT